MATRRTLNSGKDALNKDDMVGSSTSTSASATTTTTTKPFASGAVPRSVVAKLLLFTLAMIVAPLGSYYITLNTIFKGSNTLAGATAAVVANIVLIAYVIVAVSEDTTENENENAKKSQ